MASAAPNAEEALREGLVQAASTQEDDVITTQASAHEAVRETLFIELEGFMWNCSKFYFFLIAFLLLYGLWALLWSESVYEKHSQDPCDQPLAPTLRFFYIVGAVALFQADITRACLRYDMHRDGPVWPLRVKILRYGTCLSMILWPVAALWFLLSSRNCSGDLQQAVRLILFYYLTVAIVVAVLPTIVLSIILCLIRRGLLRAPRREDAAPEGFVDELPTVEFDESKFDDDIPGCCPASCPICFEKFDDEQAIKQTPCRQARPHIFHRDCLRGWLQCSRTCPLCRLDITSCAANMASDQADSAADMAAIESEASPEVLV
eukprot:TRINITY_DN56884_c0_g1_i1.p1 TRINITY_DN56884_c0_g1~~TRINITY_DN56884_c0_g1_i1.p1  ORF type:complete len:320 (+),score=51.00 TRINITY_DN56884_c0_g1_i1:95-1054(+)